MKRLLCFVFCFLFVCYACVCGGISPTICLTDYNFLLCGSLSHFPPLSAFLPMCVLVCAQVVKESERARDDIHTLRESSKEIRYVQYSTVQYSTVQYSTVQYSTVQYSTVQYSTVQYSTVRFSTLFCSTLLLDTQLMALDNINSSTYTK